MLDGELVAFLTIIVGALLSLVFYFVIARRARNWILNTDVVVAIIGNCVTLVPAVYFLIGLVVGIGQHILFKGASPVIPMDGNEGTLAVVFAYAIFLSLGSNYRLYRNASKPGAKR